MCIENVAEINLTEPTLVWKRVDTTIFGADTGPFWNTQIHPDWWMQAKGVSKGFHVFPRWEDANAYPFGNKLVPCWVYGGCLIGLQLCGNYNRVAWAVSWIYFNEDYSKDEPKYLVQE